MQSKDYYAKSVNSEDLDQTISINRGNGMAMLRQNEDFRDLDKAVELHRQSLNSHPPPHPNRDTCLNNLAVAFHSRFKQQGNEKDLQEAIELHREALSLRAPPHPDRGISLNNLGSALRTRFEQQGDLNDLEEGIEFHKEALTLHPLHHPNRDSSLNNLGDALGRRFQQVGNQKDLHEAIALHREACTLRGVQHPDHSISLNDLGVAIHDRFEQLGDLKDLDEAIELQRQAVALQEWPHPERSNSLDNLAISMHTRFMQRGDAKDLDKVVELHREALALRAPPHPDCCISLNNLASAIQARFEHRGDTKDLDEAIELHRQALALRSSSHPERRNSLNNLAGSLHARFLEFGDLQDLDDGVELTREALSLCPASHPHRSKALANLADSMHERFQEQGDVDDLDAAIELLKEALDLCGPLHPDRSRTLDLLSYVLQSRFEAKGNSSDIDKAISVAREALVLCPPPHPDRGSSLMILGGALAAMAEQKDSGHTLEDAFAVFHEASAYLASPPLFRFRHAFHWAETAARHNHSSAVVAYRAAIEILPQLSALYLDLPSRERVLSNALRNNPGSGAATCAVQLGQYSLAVEFLEATRSIFWSQVLHLRTPLDDLKTVRPDLSGKLMELSSQLEQASSREVLTHSDPEKNRALEVKGLQYQGLNEEWNKTIKSVQMIPGFEDFMGAKSMGKLQKAAIHGPIVLLHCGDFKSSSNALVVSSGGIIACVPLPRLPQLAVAVLADALDTAVYSNLIDIKAFLGKNQQNMVSSEDQSLLTRLVGTREGVQCLSDNEILGSILKILWDWMVRPIFDALNFKKSSSPPRLWWCPTGAFAFLPIHAAGVYGPEGTDCVSDYVVSSYTPTITALIHPPSDPIPLFKMTAVIQPDAPNYSPLPGTKQELERILERVPSQWLTLLSAPTQTTVQNTLSHLRESSIMHFACHGIQDVNQPLDSGLILSDGRLKIPEIMRKPKNGDGFNSRKHMSLAFLSACETAKGNDIQPDEAIHLAATFMFAGFRGVVGTLWTINDYDGPKIADTFYKHLFKNCDPNSDPPIIPDLTRAAEALHLAVAKLREEPDIPFRHWVPFVHYGL